MEAKVNLTTGKIIGAKKGSFEWFHECGHIKFDNSDLGITFGVYQNGALYGALLSFVFAYIFDIFKILAGTFVFVVVGLAIYEEMWCNKYASEKMAETAWNTLCKKKIIKAKE